MVLSGMVNGPASRVGKPVEVSEDEEKSRYVPIEASVNKTRERTLYA